MTQKSLDLYNLLIKVTQKLLTQVKAAILLGVSDRYFRRLVKGYKEQGSEAFASKYKGGNRKIKSDLKARIIQLLKTTYKDCGPTFASEKLTQLEHIHVSHETVRRIMMEEGLWESKKRKRLKVHQQRNRRNSRR